MAPDFTKGNGTVCETHISLLECGKALPIPLSVLYDILGAGGGESHISSQGEAPTNRRRRRRATCRQQLLVPILAYKIKLGQRVRRVAVLPP